MNVWIVVGLAFVVVSHMMLNYNVVNSTYNPFMYKWLNHTLNLMWYFFGAGILLIAFGLGRYSAKSELKSKGNND